MPLSRPQFELSRVFDDGSQQVIEVVPVSDLPLDARSGRRGLLSTGLGLAGVLSVLEACGGAKRPQVRTPPAVAPPEPLKAHRGAIQAIAISPDGSHVVSASSDDTVKIWPYAHGGEVKTFSAGIRAPAALAFNRDGGLISQPHGRNTDLEVWSPSDGKPYATLAGHTGSVGALAASPDGSWLASADSDRGLIVWSLDSYKYAARVSVPGGSLQNLAVTPDSKYLVSGSSDGSVDVWSIPGGQRLRRLRNPGGPNLSSLQITPDGRAVVFGDSTGMVVFLSLNDGSVLSQWKAHPDAIAILILANEGKNLLSTSNDGAVTIWDVATRRAAGTLTGPRGRLTALLWIPIGSVVVTGSLEGIMLGWSFESRRIVHYFFDPEINLNTVSGSTFSSVDRITGRTIYYTMPCGSPLPPNAVCTCNCVTGKKVPEVIRQPVAVPVCRCDRVCSCLGVCGCNPQQTCTCNRVCTCNPQCICLQVCTCVPTLMP